jgi:hypothetical protein
MSLSQSAPPPGGLSRIPFTLDAEKQIKALAFWLGIMGWVGIVAGAIDVINLVVSRNFGLIFSAILQILMGVWSLQAAVAFRQVATTDVADQAYLLVGFSRLRSIFLLQGILILVGLAFVAAVVLFVLIMGINAH